MPFFSQFSALRPWNLTSATGAVTATTGGTELLKPCGSSTQTYASVVALEEVERLVHVLFIEPATVAKLHGELEVFEMLGGPFQIAEASPGRIDERGHLEQDHAELAGRMKRHEALSETSSRPRPAVPAAGLSYICCAFRRSRPEAPRGSPSKVRRAGSDAG